MQFIHTVKGDRSKTGKLTLFTFINYRT